MLCGDEPAKVVDLVEGCWDDVGEKGHGSEGYMSCEVWFMVRDSGGDVGEKGFTWW